MGSEGWGWERSNVSHPVCCKRADIFWVFTTTHQICLLKSPQFLSLTNSVHDPVPCLSILAWVFTKMCCVPVCSPTQRCPYSLGDAWLVSAHLSFCSGSKLLCLFSPYLSSVTFWCICLNAVFSYMTKVKGGWDDMSALLITVAALKTRDQNHIAHFGSGQKKKRKGKKKKSKGNSFV